MSDPLLRITEVLEQTRVCRAKLYKMIADNQFPAPLKQGKSSYWPQSDVDTYINRLKGAKSCMIVLKNGQK